MKKLHPQFTARSFLKKNLTTEKFHFKICFLLLFVICNHTALIGQCATMPAFPDCTPATSTPLTDGASINAGNICTLSGTASFSNITLNGGQLIICGSLTLANITLNSGTIYINAGATLNCNAGTNAILNSGTNLYNNGTAIFSGHFIMNANTTVINNGTLTTPFNYIVIQGLNAYLVNNGQLTSGGFMAWIPSSPGCLCLGDMSATTTNYFYNRTTNSVVVPTGYACLNVRQYASNDNIVTADTGLAVCIPASIGYSGLPNWGNADILNNCASCSIALPIELLSFNGHILNKTAVLEWVTASEINNCFFVVERSTDAMSFTPIQTQNGAINSTSQNAYISYDNTIEGDILYYYRIKQVDCDGVYTYSNIISLNYADSYPDQEFIINNLYTESIELINEEFIEKIMIYNTLGQLISDSKSSIERINYSNGIYFIQVFSKSGKTKKYKVVKNKK